MSEFQRYEFLAIDRPLTDEERRQLRAISSRAEITATSFTNEYQWGNLKADPAKLVERYFDVLVYVANWGTHRFMLRLPADALDEALVKEFCAGANAEATRVEGQWLLDISSGRDDAPYEWWEGMETWMASLTPIRAELLQGDLRPLYLAWLVCAQEELDDEELEPPVPPGLQSLSAAQRSLAEFLYLGEDLLEVAAETSAQKSDDTAGLAGWIAGLTTEEKDRMLLEVASGEGAGVGGALLRRFLSSRAPGERVDRSAPRRTVGELLEVARQRGEAREQEDARREAEERARKEAEAAAARKRYLEALAGRTEATWEEVERLISSKQPKAYDQAVSLLRELREVGEHAGTTEQFRQRIAALLERHAGKPSFIRRVQEARLRSVHAQGR